MSQTSFRDFQQEVFRLHEEEKYQEALALVEREIPGFPEHVRHTYYWRACLLALLSRPDKAVSTLHAALDQGVWFPPTMLREDPDLKSLHGIPAFEHIQAVSRERQAAAQAKSVPQLLTLQPDGAIPPYPLLVALHGNNSNARITADYWGPVIQKGWLLGLPQSSQVSTEDAYRWDDREWAIQEVEQHYETLLRDYAVDGKRTVVGGFSMGGGTAIWIALSRTIPILGFVALGPWLADTAGLRPLLETRRESELRGSIIIGDKDRHCLKVSQEVAALMHEYGLACDLDIIPDLGHVYPDDFALRLQRALDFVLNP